MKLLDFFAWIEYFIDSERGAKVRDYVEGDKPLYTPSICLTDIKSRYLKERKDPKTKIELIVERSFIIILDEEITLLATDIKQRHGLHTIDAIIYAASQHIGLTMVTGGQHFKDLPNASHISVNAKRRCH